VAAGRRPGQEPVGGDSVDPAIARTPSAEWGETRLDATPNSAAAAEEAFQRGERALKREDMVEAVAALKLATELSPKNVDYHATFIWAQFCASRDKEGIAAETRKALERAVYKSDHPEIPRFFLGRVERMLGRDKDALRHFHEVLNHKPSHRDAQSEIRVIEARLASPTKR
jgi:cytochrome c-type biogenesis protein CcmH/NrfG